MALCSKPAAAGEVKQQGITEVTEKCGFLLNSTIFMEHGASESSYSVNSFKDPNRTQPFWWEKSIQLNLDFLPHF